MVSRAHLEEVLADNARRFGVPGAAACLLRDGEETVAVCGLARVQDGAAVTPGTCFQVGSIAKAYTATALVTLAAGDPGLLDRPLAELLPQVRFADQRATAAIAPRHLLTHTSGLSGDHFPDVAPDALEPLAAYAASCAQLGSVHAVGAMASYCNSGFVLAGRIVEQMTGSPWPTALAERVLAPAGLQATWADPDDRPAAVVAHGHVERPGAEPEPVSPQMPPRYFGPSGSLWATVADLARFGAWHLDSTGGQAGEAPDLAAMRVPAAQPPPHAWADRVGLGWSLYERDGHWLFGHDGNVCAQWAALRADPRTGAVLAVACNGGRGEAFQRATVEAVLTALDARLAAAATVRRRLPVSDDAAFAGSYVREGVHVDVTPSVAGLDARIRYSGTMRNVVEEPEETVALVGVEGEAGVFVVDAPADEPPAYQSFLADGAGGWDLFLNSRLTPRAVEPAVEGAIAEVPS